MAAIHVNFFQVLQDALTSMCQTQMAKRWKMSIVIGTGNEGQEPLHVQGRFAAQKRQKEQDSEFRSRNSEWPEFGDPCPTR